MRIVRNLIYVYISFILYFALSLIHLKILTNNLNPKDIGLFFALISVVLMISVLNKLGAQYIFPRLIPHFTAKKDKKTANALLILHSIIFWGLGILELLFILLNRKLRIFHFPELLVGFLPKALIAMLFMDFFNLLIVVLQSKRRMLLMMVFRILPYTIINSILLYISPNISINKLLNIYLLVYALFTLLLYIFLKPLPFSFSKLFKEWKPLSYFSFFSSITYPVYQYFDKILLTFASTLSAVGYYSVIKKAENIFRQILQVPLAALAPEISFRYSKGSHKFIEYKESIKLSSSLLIILASVVTVVFYIFIDYLIVFFTNKQYLGIKPYLLFLLLGIIPSSYASFLLMVKRSEGKIKSFFIANILYMILFLLLAFSLVFVFKIKGLILASVITNIVFSIFILLTSKVVPSIKSFITYLFVGISGYLSLKNLNIYIVPFLIILVIFLYITWKELQHKIKYLKEKEYEMSVV